MRISIRESLSELVWPTRCIACNQPGELLCEGCRATLPWIAQRWACPVCGAPHGLITCTGCRRGMEGSSRGALGKPPARDGAGGQSAARRLSRSERMARAWPQRATICALSFEGAAASMVMGLKDAHELRLAPVIAAALSVALDEASAWPALDGKPRFDAQEVDALCFVPATPAAYARRGFDHMELVSRPLSAITGIPLADVLARESVHDQRGLGRERRGENLASSLSVIDDVAGLRLLLCDDVVTTGSSLAAATHALLARGAASVTACALARVW